jgi:hypothetical protein
MSLSIGAAVRVSGMKQYEGQCGQIIGLTAMQPPYYIVRLEDGQRLVVRPGHLLPISPCTRATMRVR